ncbi:MAG: cytidylate kinase-like family protein [Oscillospiraceae bacterium]|nr:cytidylate kinase-like family protein [Oscillospiraceae bacterium]
MASNIITISREYGSGGRTVGELVAKKLGLPLYDREVVNAMAEKCGFSRDFIEEVGEYASVSNSFLFSLAVTSQSDKNINMMSSADQLYACQTRYIRELAEKGPCVIVGRCADHILKNREDVFHAFIYADMDFRVNYMVENYQKDAKLMPKWLREKDNRRKVYYKHYTGETWGDPHNYDVCLNTASTGIETAADIIVKLVQG